MYRTIAKKVFWELNSIIMQNLSDVLPLFCTPTWPSHHVSENQELVPLVYLEFSRFLFCFLFFFRNTTVGLEHVETPVDMKMWPLFHNGVAAGLRIAQGISQVRMRD